MIILKKMSGFSVLMAWLATVVIAILNMASCTNADKQLFKINMSHVVDGNSLVIVDNTYPTKAGHGYTVYRLKYYLSDFVLQDDQEKKYSFDTIHLFDIEDETSSQFSLGELAKANYTKLSFVFGLDEMRNREGGLANNMINNSMEWPVIGEKGYHYMKFEGKYDSLGSGVLKNFNLHTGPTGNNNNYVNIILDIPIENMLEGIGNLEIEIEMDINKILHGPIDYNFTQFAQGIMPIQEAQEILKKNASDVFRIISVNEKD